MNTCAGCGLAVRDGDDEVVVGERHYHVDCAEPPSESPGKRSRWWKLFASAAADVGD